MRYNARQDFDVIDTKGNKQHIEKGDIISDYGDVLCGDVLINYTTGNAPFLLRDEEIEKLLEKRKEKYCVYRSFAHPKAFVDVLFTGTEKECNEYFNIKNKEIYKKHGRADIEQVWVDVEGLE